MRPNGAPRIKSTSTGTVPLELTGDSTEDAPSASIFNVTTSVWLSNCSDWDLGLSGELKSEIFGKLNSGIFWEPLMVQLTRKDEGLGVSCRFQDWNRSWWLLHLETLYLMVLILHPYVKRNTSGSTGQYLGGGDSHQSMSRRSSEPNSARKFTATVWSLQIASFNKIKWKLTFFLF